MIEADKSDPFNYPFPKRSDLMSLQTITHKDTGFNKIKVIQNECLNLKTNDIKGAKADLRGYKYQNKETYINRNDDIEGAQRNFDFNKQYNKPSYGLTNDDIPKSKPQQNQFVTTRPPSNPLCPEYKLPYAEIRESTPPKFIRDQIKIDDIEGTHPNPNKYFKPRKNVVNAEIEGTHPKQRFIPKDQIDIMNVKDINEYLKFESKRIVDPQNPIYTLTGENGEKIQYGKIEKSSTRQLHPEIVNKPQDFCLKVQDIQGATADTHAGKFLRKEAFSLSLILYLKQKKKKERKDFRNNTNTLDIQGAQPGTAKKGFTTLRQTNPLQPVYNYLGENEGYYPQGHLPSYDGKVQIASIPNIGMIKLENVGEKRPASSGIYNNTNQIQTQKVQQEQQQLQSIHSKKSQDLQKQIQRPASQQSQKSQQQFSQKQSVKNQEIKSRSSVRSMSSYTRNLTKAQKFDQFIQN